MKVKRFISLILSLVMLVSACSVVGEFSAFAATLSKPTVTLTNASTTSIKVSWAKVSGATKYTVYKSTAKSSGYKAIKTTTSTSVTSGSLTCGKTYYYKVKAISGSKSATSTVVSKKAAPAKLSAPTVSATCTSIKVSWSKASGVTGYQVYYATAKGGTYKKLAATTSTSYTNKLSLGTTRYYKVRAYKKVGSSYVYGAFSAIVSKKTAHSPSSSWTVTKKATCGTTGVKTNKCKYCGKNYNVTIEKDDTNHSYVASVVPADDTYESYNKYTCTVCGDVYTAKMKKHDYNAVVTEPTCTEQGYTTYTCEDCEHSYKGAYTDLAPHSYEKQTVPANCVDYGYTYDECAVCVYIDYDSVTTDESLPPTGTAHNYETITVAATCITDGYTINRCTICNNDDVSTKVITEPALGHDYGTEYQTDDSGYRLYNCSRCDKQKVDTTCYIDLTEKTISVPAVAEFNKSSSNTTDEFDKLDLNPDDESKYEITGYAENLTIDVNADRDVDIKLSNVTINNVSKDCIAIKNKATDTVDEDGNVIAEAVTPEVSISAKDGTSNTLTSTTSGNAIDSDCELSLKGKGVLLVNTTSTSFNCNAKVNIKNLTLDITSSNRGIDTKSTVTTTNEAGTEITTTSYYNIKIEPNANITINSADDCIRCKNMEITALSDGDEDTIMNLKSTAGDGIQIEGNNGFSAYSGNITINAYKYAFNCSSAKINIYDGATVSAKGGTAYSK